MMGGSGMMGGRGGMMGRMADRRSDSASAGTELARIVY